MTTPTPAPSAPQSEASKIAGLLFTLGIEAASIFIKNPNHVKTASTIISLLGEFVPNLGSIL